EAEVEPVPVIVEPAAEAFIGPPSDVSPQLPAPLKSAAPLSEPPVLPRQVPDRLLTTLAGWGARTPDEPPVEGRGRAVHTAVQEIPTRKRLSHFFRADTSPGK